jgi:hypothetical protein
MNKFAGIQVSFGGFATDAIAKRGAIGQFGAICDC